MKKLHLSFLFSLAVLTASSQKVYFLYIQTESEQPFFVKIKDKVQSSTASGYIILPKLLDSTYSFSIGFPQAKWPEQNFTVTMAKKDHGYLLKNFGEKGWGLFDLQTLIVQMSATEKTAAIEEKPKPEYREVSPFTEILSKAADDPSLKEKPVLPKVEEKKEVAVVVKEVPKKEESKSEVKETAPTKPVDVAIVPVVKKEETKTIVTETVSTKPSETISQPVVKKEETKAISTENAGTKPVEITEQAIAKKEEPKTEVKETVQAKPTEVAIVPAVAKEEPGSIPTEAISTKPVGSVEQPVVAKKEDHRSEIKEEAIKPVEEVAQPISNHEEIKETPVAESYKASQVKKWSESSTTEGFGLVFIDDYNNGTKDTIRLVIPNPKPMVGGVKEEPKEEKKFIEITNEAAKTEEVKPAEAKPVVTQTVVAKPVVTNNCTDIATESDFFKLRKKMAAIVSDDDMVSEARKYFKTKCFTTAQVKNLSTLFLSDEGKYKFFDVAYKYVSDAPTFNALQTELKDEYYVSRFKAMLRN